MINHFRFIALIALAAGCNSRMSQENGDYESEILVIHQIGEHVYTHTSFLNTQTFGRVACNGMIVFDKDEAIIFDTPTDSAASLELIDWVERKLNCKIKAIIPTHFHGDCLGGLAAFHDQHIPSFAHNVTIQFAASNNPIVPQTGFDDRLELRVGDKLVIADFVGEGHTKDNIIGFFPAENIMFGGCLIKELQAGKGYLDDANVGEWSTTVKNIREKYPTTKIVVPGHGKSGGQELFDYTIKLFEEK